MNLIGEQKIKKVTSKEKEDNVVNLEIEKKKESKIFNEFIFLELNLLPSDFAPLIDINSSRIILSVCLSLPFSFL